MVEEVTTRFLDVKTILDEGRCSVFRLAENKKVFSRGYYYRIEDPLG